MKKITFALIVIALLLGGPLLTSAQEPPMPGPQPTNINIWVLLTTALQWLFNIVIFIAAIMLVWAGFTYVTSGGNQDKIKNALNTLMYALIGVAVAILAKSLIYIIGQFLHTPVTF